MNAPVPRPDSWPILIAGRGPASLSLALALARSGGSRLEVVLVAPSAPPAAGRAYALSPASARMLDALGLGTLIDEAQPIAGMRITDSRLPDPIRPAYLRFEPEPDGTLGYMVEGPALATALADVCRAAGVQVELTSVAGFATDGGSLSVRLAAGPSRRAALLVAADGARSRLRELAGIDWVGRRYRQAGLVATVAHARDHGGLAVQHFLPAGPFAILPLRPGSGALPYRSSLVWTEEAGRAAAILAGPPDALREELDLRFGTRLGALALENGPSSHPLGAGLARSFVRHRFALLGDAAHEIHPLAGQGLNLGLADAASLAERILDAVRLGLDPGAEDVLAAYERDRRFDAVAMAAATDGLNRLFSNGSLPLRALRDLGLGIVDRLPALKNAFAREAAGETRRAPRLLRGEAL